MIANFFKITLRNLLKNKSQTFINIGGLTLGFVCTLVIFLVIQFEFSYDAYHRDNDRIYRVVRQEQEFGEVRYDRGVPYPMPEAMRNDFSNIEALTIVDVNFGTPVLSVEQEDGSVRRFKQNNVGFVHNDYFKIFTYEWLTGNPETVLTRPNTAVISNTLAEKLFGNVNPVGKSFTMQTSNKYDLVVAGVVKDPPPNTDVPLRMLVAFDTASRTGDKRISDDWDSTSSSWQCFLKLENGIDAEEINRQMDTFLGKYREQEAVDRLDYFLQPLSEVHYDSRFGSLTGRAVPKELLLGLGLIGFFLLITACINFINLNTAVAVRRSKEVGVRKALGGTRKQLFLHFQGETAVVTFLSVLAALGVTELVLEFITPLMGYSLDLNLINNSGLLLFIGGIFVVTSVIAGLYPALYLSRFNTIEAIRNRINASYGKGLTLRRSLVVLQFTISQALIICTIVISSQMDYFRNADMGFKKEAVVEVGIPVSEQSRLETFESVLESQTSIRNVTFSNTGTANGNIWGGNYTIKTGEEITEGEGQIKFVDSDFVETYGLEILAGSNLQPSDSVSQYLVNESFARKTGFGDNYRGLIGQVTEIWGEPAPIAGVVRDFHTSSLRSEIKPVLLTTYPGRFQMAGVKINMQQTQQAIGLIEKAFSAAFPEYVFDYMFLDERIARFYQQEQQTARLMNIFTVIAILLGAFGLFGLVSYMASTRTKEIGVRKVLGATIRDIIGLFSKEFLILLGISFAISAPAAWMLMHQWLSNFANRIEMGPGLFLLAFLATVSIAVLTVGYKSFRAANLNPVESLNVNE